jgi:hypothetical protein
VRRGVRHRDHASLEHRVRSREPLGDRHRGARASVCRRRPCARSHCAREHERDGGARLRRPAGPSRHGAGA